jgi:hypothetical protein
MIPLYFQLTLLKKAMLGTLPLKSLLIKPFNLKGGSI